MSVDTDKVRLHRLTSKPHQIYNMTVAAYMQRAKLTPARLRALRKGAVPAKGVLNPYGRYGCADGDDRDHEALRPEAMKRTRLTISKTKLRALEAHELQKIAREAAEDAMRTLKEICKNKRAPEATRIAASAVILDRGYGKASQTSITANVTNGKARDITSDELDRRTTAALKRVEELTNRTPKTGASTARPTDLRKYN
jgi:hypothetical protein